MIKIDVNYKGKSYRNISDAFERAMMDGIKEEIEKTIKPFYPEIKKHNGKVKIVIDNLDKVKVEFDNLPDELINRIESEF